MIAAASSLARSPEDGPVVVRARLRRLDEMRKSGLSLDREALQHAESGEALTWCPPASELERGHDTERPGPIGVYRERQPGERRRPVVTRTASGAEADGPGCPHNADVEAAAAELEHGEGQLVGHAPIVGAGEVEREGRSQADPHLHTRAARDLEAERAREAQLLAEVDELLAAETEGADLEASPGFVVLPCGVHEARRQLDACPACARAAAALEREYATRWRRNTHRTLVPIEGLDEEHEEHDEPSATEAPAPRVVLPPPRGAAPRLPVPEQLAAPVAAAPARPPGNPSDAIRTALVARIESGETVEALALETGFRVATIRRWIDSPKQRRIRAALAAQHLSSPHGPESNG